MKAIITCGGLGTRLMPYTKESPKEMTPVFYQVNKKSQIIPLVQLIFETLYEANVREFCFVTGRTKRSIENHFTIDEFSNEKSLESFFYKLKNSKILWVTQNNPKGFGDALSCAEPFIDNEFFIIQAGDVAIIQKKTDIINQLVKYSKDNAIDAMLCVRKVKDPKRHGVVELEGNSEPFSVVSAEEKPDNPKTDLAIMPIYLFNKNIFDALDNILPGKNNELQLTDAIQYLIKNGKKVKALRVDDEMFWDVGTPESFWQAINDSHNYSIT